MKNFIKKSNYTDSQLRKLLSKNERIVFNYLGKRIDYQNNTSQTFDIISGDLGLSKNTVRNIVLKLSNGGMGSHGRIEGLNLIDAKRKSKGFVFHINYFYRRGKTYPRAYFYESYRPGKQYCLVPCFGQSKKFCTHDVHISAAPYIYNKKNKKTTCQVSTVMFTKSSVNSHKSPTDNVVFFKNLNITKTENQKINTLLSKYIEIRHKKKKILNPQAYFHMMKQSCLNDPSILENVQAQVYEYNIQESRKNQISYSVKIEREQHIEYCRKGENDRAAVKKLIEQTILNGKGMRLCLMN